MRVTIFLATLFVFSLLISCAEKGAQPEEDTDPPDGDPLQEETGEEGPPEEESRAQRNPLNLCTKNGYELYSEQGCDEFLPGQGMPHPPQALDFSSSNQGTKKEDIEYVPYRKKLVDFVFVVDSTHVMDYYLRNKEGFISRFSSFLSEINPHLDWRALFIEASHTDYGRFLAKLSTNKRDGKAFDLEDSRGLLNLKQIGPHTPLYSSLFMYAITRFPRRNTIQNSIQRHGHRYYQICKYPPYCQRPVQQPLKALRSSFSKNKQFTRHLADLAVVILTNSDEKESKKSRPVSPQQVVTEFQKVYGSQKKLWAFNLIILPGDSVCKEINRKRHKKSGYGTIVSGLPALSSGGGNFSICLKSYIPVAKTIVQIIRGSSSHSSSTKRNTLNNNNRSNRKQTDGFSKISKEDPFDASIDWK